MALALSEDPNRAAPSHTTNGQSDEPSLDAQIAPPRFRLLWLLIGWFFFALGFVGIFLVLLPTTGFWILAALAFERSNPAIARRIRNWPHFGAAVSLYLDHGVISKRGKIAALTAMALCAAIAGLTLQGVALWAGVAGIGIGALYVGTRPSAPRI